MIFFGRNIFQTNKLVIRKYFNEFVLQKCRLSDNRIRLSYYNITPINSKISAENSSPVLIYHGLFGTKNNWKSISKSISAKTGRSVYAFDLRNHGLSAHTSGADNTLEGMANDIQLFLDENNYEKAILIGHSLGGRAVLQFSFLWPNRVEKLIAVDITPLSSIPSAFFLSPKFIDQLSDSIKNVSNDLGLGDARKQVNENLKPIISDQFIRGFFLMSLDKEEESGKLIWRFNLDAIKYMIEHKLINNIEIKTPFSGHSLVIHGQNSDYVKRSDYNAIRELMPNVKFVSIPETGHYLHIEKPNQFVDSVVSFLNFN